MRSGTESNRGTKCIPRLAKFNPRLALIGFLGTRARAFIRSFTVRQLEDVADCYDDDTGEEGDVYGQLFCVGSSRGRNPYMVTVLLNGVKVTVEIDIGASTTVVHEKTFHNLAQSERALKLNVANTVLRTYTGEVILVVEECELEVEYNRFKGSLPAVVSSGEGDRSWLQYISLNWSQIFHLTTMDRDLNEMLETRSSTVQENLGEKEGVKVKIFVWTSREAPTF